MLFRSDALVLFWKFSAPHSLSSNMYTYALHAHNLTLTCRAIFNVSSAQAMMMDRDHLVNKKGKTFSAVWKHFGFKESDEERQQIL